MALLHREDTGLIPAQRLSPGTPNELILGKNELSATEFVRRCLANGLEPKEITEDQALQRIIITHNPLKGQISWETKNLDGLAAILTAIEATVLMQAIVTARGAVSLCTEFTRGDKQLDLGTGEAVAVVAFKDSRLIWDGKPNRLAVKRLLAAVLLGLIAQDDGEPFEQLIHSSLG